MASVGEESELQRQEREAREKHAAETGGIPEPPRPISEQSFMQYMQLVEEGRRRDQEVQNKFLHDLLETQAGRARNGEPKGVTLSDFQNTSFSLKLRHVWYHNHKLIYPCLPIKFYLEKFECWEPPLNP